MKFIDNDGVHDPHVNLAFEEYALRHFDAGDSYLLFYVNDPSIIIGRNQNTLEEINDSYVRENGIHVVRRLSGGGAVYHDHGNLNYSFITDTAQDRLSNFEHFVGPVVDVLRDLGVPAEISGRNDIVVNGRKISGNAQFSTGKRMFSHGTLLFDSELDEVTRALDVKMTKLESKGHKSVRSRVANISEFLDEPMDVQSFRQRLLDGLIEARDLSVVSPSEEQWREIEALADERYRTWDWNFGASPDFNVHRVERFDAIGEVDVRLEVVDGFIEEASIYGDFLGHGDVETVENALTGTRYTEEAVHAALDPVDTRAIFGGLPPDDFAKLVYGEDVDS